jgi:hypothetical protein
MTEIFEDFTRFTLDDGIFSASDLRVGIVENFGDINNAKEVNVSFLLDNCKYNLWIVGCEDGDQVFDGISRAETFAKLQYYRGINPNVEAYVVYNGSKNFGDKR